MEQFRAELHACDPARGIFRRYRIEAGTDLLGDWLVDVTYGRIGTPGRRIRHVAASEQEARKIVRHCLQRRSSAPKRIGVGYQLRELSDPAKWLAIPARFSARRHVSISFSPASPAPPPGAGEANARPSDGCHFMNVCLHQLGWLGRKDRLWYIE